MDFFLALLLFKFSSRCILCKACERTQRPNNQSHYYLHSPLPNPFVAPNPISLVAATSFLVIPRTHTNAPKPPTAWKHCIASSPPARHASANPPNSLHFPKTNMLHLQSRNRRQHLLPNRRNTPTKLLRLFGLHMRINTLPSNSQQMHDRLTSRTLRMLQRTGSVDMTHCPRPRTGFLRQLLNQCRAELDQLRVQLSELCHGEVAWECERA